MTELLRPFSPHRTLAPLGKTDPSQSYTKKKKKERATRLTIGLQRVCTYIYSRRRSIIYNRYNYITEGT